MQVYTYEGMVLVDSADGKWLKKAFNPLNPLDLPPLTIRIKLSSGASTPTISGATVTTVAGQADVYDVCTISNNWYQLFYNNKSLTEVLGANSTGVTNMSYMFCMCSSLTSVPLFDTSSVSTFESTFDGCKFTSVPLFDTSGATNMRGMFGSCSSLTSVPLFDTSSVTDMYYMFGYCSSLTSVPVFNTSNVTNMNSMFTRCSSLTSVPLFDTSSVTDMNSMFNRCTRVKSGALALYQQASTQTNPPSNHTNTFTNCGSNTTTGAAELAQIPSSWGGTAT